MKWGKLSNQITQHDKKKSAQSCTGGSFHATFGERSKSSKKVYNQFLMSGMREASGAAAAAENDNFQFEIDELNGKWERKAKAFEMKIIQN